MTLNAWPGLGLILLLAACASGGSRDLEYDRVLDFASNQLADGDPSAARQSLVELQFKPGADDQRRDYYRLLGAVNLRLSSYGEAIEAFHRSREYPTPRDTANFQRTTAIGIARANQGLQRWLAAERHLEEALGHSVDQRERDEIYLLYARGAAERRDAGAARSWLDRVSDRDRWAYGEIESRLRGDRNQPRSNPRSSRGSETVADRIKGRGEPRPLIPSKKDPVPRSATTRRKQPAPRSVRSVAPRIMARQDWGAQPLRMSGNPGPMPLPWRITVHHAADSQAPTRESDAAARMRSYQQGHFKRGWADVGYHFVIDGAGRVWEGRLLRWEGAHAGTQDLNRGNVGVCLMGNFENHDPNRRQLSSLRGLLDWLCDRYGISYTRIVGHNEGLRGTPGKGTACPGRRLQTALTTMRKEMKVAAGS